MQPESSCESCLLPLTLCSCYPSQPPAFSDDNTTNFNYAGSSRGQERTLPADSTRFNAGTAETAPRPLFASLEQSGWPTNPLPLLGTQWLYRPRLMN
ncbi:hypothetical protein K443DRAFT_103272 [Laccaria amethystina LaAM-08-1]|uniref:Uncharacterized protein n=1 Tax=Laccaria amethystina LaAM-08-1 TaxID=1095629 RepID=A0A0C9WN78_9AGAR|nr:hypothetical protein K443DRAFT_103272 [Laccaria amethystina LaAM-08-1]